MIPSRGALVMSGRGEERGALDAALRSRGYSTGKEWSGDARVAMTRDTGGVVAAGTHAYWVARALSLLRKTWRSPK